VFADPQTGKVASRGGTEQLLDRYATTLQRLGNYIADANAQQGVWLDAGDAVESFENTLEQQQTNDLSLMSQVDVATFLEFEGIDLMCKTLPRVVAAGVGSNHCRWRQGKANMGTPADDWGLHMLRQVRKWTAKLAGDQYAHLDVVVPQRHDETLALDVCGQIIGLAHGHQVAGRTTSRTGGRGRRTAGSRSPTPTSSSPATSTTCGWSRSAGTRTRTGPAGGCRPRRWTTGRTGSGTTRATTPTPACWCSRSPATGGMG
jgi:hypothetical protein